MVFPSGEGTFDSINLSGQPVREHDYRPHADYWLRGILLALPKVLICFLKMKYAARPCELRQTSKGSNELDLGEQA
jgi:hypothetical protein